MNLLNPKGGLIIIGSEPTTQNSLTRLKNKIIGESVDKYLGPKRRAGSKFYTHSEKKYNELLLSSRFGSFNEYFYEAKLTRTTDEIVGHVFSMSWASRKLLGNKAVDFETELRQKLRAISNSQKFIERFKFSMYTLEKF